MEEQGTELAKFKKVDDSNSVATTVNIHPQGDTKTITSDESEKKSISWNKSRITRSLADSISPQLDLAIEQVEKDHYLYRRGSTQVHVQTYEAATASDLVHGSKTKQMIYYGLKLISPLIGMLLLIITLALKLTNAITDEVPERVVDQYNLSLYAFGFLWATYYILKGVFCNKDNVNFLKSHQSSNRWLKGVVILFGLGIILKDGLNFVSNLMVDLTVCADYNTKVALSMFQACFVIAQTMYIFNFSKAYIRNCNAGSSTGLMILVAINLSTWVTAVIDETLHALHEEEKGIIAGQNARTTQSPYSNSSETYAKASYDEDSDDVCSCSTNFCNVASTADTFLFPFLIEYSLVASCLIYITWDNVGKTPPPCEKVIKPSYKFYGHYRGATLGTLVFFLTIIFLIVLGTSASDASFKTYFTELVQLNLYMCFLAGLELFMVIGTIWGFYLFYRIRRPLEKIPMLDQVLLVVCILGPLIYNTFSMIAVIGGSRNKDTLWVFTLLYPLMDQLQSLFQLMFILYGLRREPITSASAKETSKQLAQGIKDYFKQSKDEEESSESGFDNKTYLRSRRSSVTSVMTKIATTQPPNSPPPNRYLTVEDSRHFPELGKTPPAPEIVISTSTENLEPFDDQATTSDRNMVETGDEYKQTILKIVSEMHVARPNAMRFHLRDAMIFLLIANACIWLFQSLSGTAYVIFQYESVFFGPSTWTTIRLICRPLAIFFRMHSAGCLFEMWSYA